MWGVHTSECKPQWPHLSFTLWEIQFMTKYQVSMNVPNLLGIIPVLTCLELRSSCLTLYPFTPPGGGLQVTNTDVTTCPERTTSCGTSGTEDDKQALTLFYIWAPSPVWQKLNCSCRQKNHISLNDVISLCTRDSLYIFNVLVWRIMLEGLLRFSPLMLITLIAYRSPGARPSKL